MHNSVKTRRAVISAVAGFSVAAATLVMAPGAFADPKGAPQYRALAGVGSDTTQDLGNGLGQVVVNGTTKIVGSYNATGSATIKPKSDATAFARPNGSSDGIAALKAAKTSGTWNGTKLKPSDLQFARSSSAGEFVSGGKYSYIPLALDAVSYARNAGGAVPANIPLGNNIGQDTDKDGVRDLTLKNIYGYQSGKVTLEDANNKAFTVGNQASGSQIVPFIPQDGSGTRKFWLSALGVTTIPARVVAKYSASGTTKDVQEHDGSVTQAVKNAIVPFSIAQHIAQSKASTLSSAYGVTVTDRRKGAVLGQVNKVAPTASGVLNTKFPISRPVFTVVQYSELSSNANLKATFQGATAKAYTAKRPGGTQKVITDFGFGDLGSGVTIGGKTYKPGDTTSHRAN